MTVLEYSKKRLVAFLEEVKELQALEFPYPHSGRALQQIQNTFSVHLEALNKLSSASDPTTVRAACKSALSALFIYLPLVGFIVRSTEVRNSFEIYGPLLKLVRTFLGPSTKLILSSEWDYSPFTYLGIPVLRDFVLIGLPAPESDNPLLIPLAGHELGHSSWRRQSPTAIAQELEKWILEEIREHRWTEYQKLFSINDKGKLESDLYAKQTWIPAHAWSFSQSEESFCDFMGLRIFGNSFLNAFAFLLAPNQGGDRSVQYPNMRARVANIVMAAQEYGTVVPTNYQDLFEDMPEPAKNEPQTKFLLEVADSALISVIPKLIKMADEITLNAGVQSDSIKIKEMYDEFKRYVIPARNPGFLWDILNAGWEAFLDPDLWQDHKEVKFPDRTLKELILKSIEVLEFRDITQKSI